MSVQTIKNEMLKMTQSELSQIISIAQQIKSISATATFSVGQQVMVIHLFGDAKQTPGVILKMNPKKAIVEMPWKGSTASVSVPLAMLEAA